MTFRTRLTLVSMAAVAVAIVLASAVIFGVVRNQLRSQVDDALRGRLQAVSYRVLPDRIRIEFPDLPLGAASGYAQVVTADGDVALQAGETVVLPVSDRALRVAAGQEDAFFSETTVSGIHLRVLTAPLARGLGVQVARPLDEVDRSLGRLRLFLLAVGAGGIALAAGIGALVARAALAPVRRLSAATEHVTTTGDLTRRIEASTGDELGRLASSFNTMLQALETSMRSQRQLVADASHELRTPLTSLRTNIEVLATGQQLPPEERDRLLRDMVAQVDELTVLLSDLVELARGAEPVIAMEEVRLDELVAQAVERARRYAPQVRFETELEPSMVRGVPSRLERAVGNLLDNAAKWSPPDGTVEVRVRDGEVMVRDHGPGISEADLPFVFDRFYRAPSARGMPGSGLGLAIVRQVAETHGGSVSAELPPDGGSLFRLRLDPLPMRVVPAAAETPSS
jgi:two-component system sensor histidine kinase MprB